MWFSWRYVNMFESDGLECGCEWVADQMWMSWWEMCININPDYIINYVWTYTCNISSSLRRAHVILYKNTKFIRYIFGFSNQFSWKIYNHSILYDFTYDMMCSNWQQEKKTDDGISIFVGNIEERPNKSLFILP